MNTRGKSQNNSRYNRKYSARANKTHVRNTFPPGAQKPGGSRF